MLSRTKAAIAARRANPPASVAFLILGLLLLAGTFIFAQAIGQLFGSTLPPAALMYAGFAVLGIGWWYLPRMRAVQIVVGAPMLFLAAIGGLLLVVELFGELLDLAGIDIGGGHEHATP